MKITRLLACLVGLLLPETTLPRARAVKTGEKDFLPLGASVILIALPFPSITTAYNEIRHRGTAHPNLRLCFCADASYPFYIRRADTDSRIH